MGSVVALDIGNTKTKILIKKNKLYSCETLEQLNKIIDETCLKDTTLIYSQVGKSSLEIDNIKKLFESDHQNIIVIKNYYQNDFFLEMPVNYELSAGIDRLVCAHWAFQKYHNSSFKNSLSLVVDAGTFITMDAISKTGFLGGYISPGSYAWASAYDRGAQLNQFKNELIEAIPITKNLFIDWPQTTVNAMRNSFWISLMGSLTYLENIHEIKRIIFTGGDGEYLYKAYQTYHSHSKQKSQAELKFIPDLTCHHLINLAEQLSAQ